MRCTNYAPICSQKASVLPVSAIANVRKIGLLQMPDPPGMKSPMRMPKDARRQRHCSSEVRAGFSALFPTNPVGIAICPQETGLPVFVTQKIVQIGAIVGPRNNELYSRIPIIIFHSKEEPSCRLAAFLPQLSEQTATTTDFAGASLLIKSNRSTAGIQAIVATTLLFHQGRSGSIDAA